MLYELEADDNYTEDYENDKELPLEDCPIKNWHRNVWEMYGKLYGILPEIHIFLKFLFPFCGALNKLQADNAHLHDVLHCFAYFYKMWKEYSDQNLSARMIIHLEKHWQIWEQPLLFSFILHDKTFLQDNTSISIAKLNELFMVSDDDRNGDFFNNDFEYSEHDIKTPHDGQTIDLDQIVKTRHPLLNKKAKWKLNDIFNLEKIEAPIYLSSLSERTLTDITNQENNHIVPTHIQKFNQELSKLDNYTKDKDINSLYVIVLTFFEEIGQRYNLESVADDFPCLSFVIDFHDPYGKLDSLYRKYFGINYKDIEIYQSYDIFHVNKHLDKYIKESIEKDLLAIPDDYGGLDKIYFELA
ncbi:5172_t:CDS:2, partial [Entrophospora sp. SA101]